MSLPSFSIRNHMTVVVIVGIILVTGIMAYQTLPRESFPDITIPNIVVTTMYEGVSPSDMENLITDPIEKQVAAIGDVKEIRSYTSEGMSVITIEFGSDIDIDSAMQKVRDKVDEAKKDLPDDLEDDPQVDEINFSEFPIMTVIVHGPVGLVRLKQIAEDLQDEFERIPGVLQTPITGGLEREIRVMYEPERLASYGLSVTELMDTVLSNNVNTPSGDMDIGAANFLVKVPGEFDTPEEARRLIVHSEDGFPIYLSDLARMEDGFEDVKTRARYNGKDAVSIDVIKRSGENIIVISDEVKRILAETQRQLPESVQLSIVNDQSRDIRQMVGDLENSILSGLILVLAVVFFAMGFRNALLVASAIPLSMLITFFMLQLIGMTLNMVVLFSLVLAVGMLVDNAIVIIENIYRHREEGKPAMQAAIDATHEVMWPVTASAATTIAAFAPLVFWPGMTGEFMKFLPVTVIVSLAASLFVALVVNPTLGSLFIRVRPGVTHTQPGMLLRAYGWGLRWAVRTPVFTVVCAFSMLVLTFFVYARLGQGVEFFPPVDPPRAYVDINMPEGTSLSRTDRVARQVEELAMQYPDVRSVITGVGSVTTGPDAFLGSASQSPDMARVMLEFRPMMQREVPAKSILHDMREHLSGTYSASIEIQEEEGGPPTGAPVNIELSGEHYEVLAPIMRQIKEHIRGVPGLVDLKDDYSIARPEIEVEIDKERAALLNLSTVAVAQQVKAAIRGIEAGTYRDGTDEYDILVRLPLERRRSLDALSNLLIAQPDGGFVPISSVADLGVSAGLGTIVRVDQKRVITIEGEADGRLATEVMADIQTLLQDYPLPRGYTISYRGESEDREEAEGFLTGAFLGALMLIALILVTEFNSIYKPIIILTSVILSTMGVFIGLMILQEPFGIIMTGIGVISLAGVVVNNAIVLLDYAGQLRDRGLGKVDSLVQAGMVRFRPVLLTAITTILGLIPMAVGISFDFRTGGWQTNTESSQWWGPMATAVIFGLAISTILTLVVVPAMMAIGDHAQRNVSMVRQWFGREEKGTESDAKQLPESP